MELSGIVDSLSLPNTVFLVAEENNKILGYIGMYLSIDEGEITNVAVSPNAVPWHWRHAACGSKKRGREPLGRQRIVLEVRCSNDSAIRLYERNGFVNHGVRKGFYEFPKEDAYIMIYGQ